MGRHAAAVVLLLTGLATRDLTRDAHFYGLADVVAGFPISVTQTVHAGTYHVLEVGALRTDAPATTTLRVRGEADPKRAEHHAAVVMTPSDTFIAPEVLPAKVNISVRNASDTLHFMNIWRVPTRNHRRRVQVLARLGRRRGRTLHRRSVGRAADHLARRAGTDELPVAAGHVRALLRDR